MTKPLRLATRQLPVPGLRPLRDPVSAPGDTRSSCGLTTSREGWLRADDGTDYTASAAAEAAALLARGDGKPGSYTPAAAFGPDLASTAGSAYRSRLGRSSRPL